MKPVFQVRKRDGRLVEFDEDRIADAIYKAALSVGGEDRFLAEELASVVALFLEKTYQEGIPTIEDVQDMVERVLIETGHARTAKSYILYREKRAKLREAAERARHPVQGQLFRSGPITLLEHDAERIAPFSTERLARRLSAETELSPETAVAIAHAVEERIVGLELARLDDHVLRWITHAELASRGLFKALRELSGAEIDGRRLTGCLFPKEAERRGTPEERIAAAVLRQHSLSALHPADVVEAHLAGRIHLRGLGTPARVFCAALSPDGLREAGVPGVPGRVRPGDVCGPRRLAAWLGRVVRAVAPAVSHGISLTRFNVLAAPLYAGLSRDDLREEAWHLLTELAGVPGMEVELSLLPPSILAARKVRGAAGEAGPETYGEFAETALRFAEALLEVRGTGEGLGARSNLPRLVLTISEEALGDSGALEVVARALVEALAREPLVLVLDREDLPLLGTRRLRERLEDATRLTDTRTLAVVCAARAVVNLPRAAWRAGRGNPSGLVEEADAAAKLAIEGLVARQRFLTRAAAAPDGPLVPATGGRGGGAPVVDLARATYSVAVTGLNEAVAHVTGEELHESDEALKLGRRVLGSLQLLCRELRGEGFDVALDAEEDPRVAWRFHLRDREDFAVGGEEFVTTYTPGARLRADAPVDLALRLESEGRLGLALRTATVECFLDPEEHPSPETLLALLRKTWRNTRVRQLVLGRRA